MTIQPIGPSSVVLYITPGEWRARELEGPDREARLLPLARWALARTGIASEGPLELELFVSACGTLLFGRRLAGERRWFSVTRLEELLAAARSAAAPPEGAALFWLEERWWLSLPAEEQRWVHILSEFGQPRRTAPPLSETHGAVIFPQGAFSRLLAYFPR